MITPFLFFKLHPYLFRIKIFFEWILFLNIATLCHVDRYGRVAEWPIAAVLKTAVGKPTVGSNPTSSVCLLT